jgi:hypothetical protein
MNREGAETYLRLLAEASLRDLLAHAQDSVRNWSAGGGRTRMAVVGQVLIMVGALEADAFEGIANDFNLALTVRELRQPAPQRPGRGVTRLAAQPATTFRAVAAAHWAAQSRPVRPGPPATAGRLGPAGSAERAGPSGPVPSGPGPGGGGADRFVPVGLTIPFHHGGVGGDLYLMSYARTGSGARFIVAWGIRTPSLQHLMSYQRLDLIPFDQFTVTDDRGARYQLDCAAAGDPEWTGEVGLHPAPPEDIRWLDVTAPPGSAARVDLRPARPAGDEPQVTEAEHSPGERLLIVLAERLLTTAPEYPQHRPRPGMPGLVHSMATNLGDIVGALEAADVLSPLSPVPARLATLCASLNIGGHGLAVPPALELPEPWLSLLAHYQRRKPDPAPAREGYAGLAADLPELDGIRLALLGLHHTGEGSSLHVLARGLMPASHPGPLGLDRGFPLSIWVRDSGGRWHAARAADRRWTDGECTARLQLVPPLTRPTDSVEVLVSGQSAEVRTRLPLRWGSPS